jgi:hypothetical protein
MAVQQAILLQHCGESKSSVVLHPMRCTSYRSRNMNMGLDSGNGAHNIESGENKNARLSARLLGADLIREKV